jgi:hypothetical protein
MDDTSHLLVESFLNHAKEGLSFATAAASTTSTSTSCFSFSYLLLQLLATSASNDVKVRSNPIGFDPIRSDLGLPWSPHLITRGQEKVWFV